MEERATVVVGVMPGDALFEVGKSPADTVLVPLQSGQVDPVGGVSGEEFGT